MIPILAMSPFQWLMAVALFSVCALLMVIILVQKGRGGGLAAAFGGGGGSSAFGAKTGDVFTGITVALAAVFLVLTVTGNYIFKPATGLVQPRAVQSPPPGQLDDQPGRGGAPDVTRIPATAVQIPDPSASEGAQPGRGGASNVTRIPATAVQIPDASATEGAQPGDSVPGDTPVAPAPAESGEEGDAVPRGEAEAGGSAAAAPTGEQGAETGGDGDVGP